MTILITVLLSIPIGLYIGYKLEGGGKWFTLNLKTSIATNKSLFWQSDSFNLESSFTKRMTLGFIGGYYE